jgi:ribosome-associated protein
MSGMDGLEKARIAAEAALGKVGRDLVVLDVRELVSFADLLVIVSAGSDRQVRAIAEAIETALARRGVHPLGIEGAAEGRWVLMDYADVIVHVFQHEVRSHYDLERLWSDAPQLGLGLAGGAAHHGTLSR